MELSKEKTMKIIEQYLKHRAYAKIYYQDYQQKNKEKINAYNIEQYYKKGNKSYYRRKNTTKERKKRKQKRKK